MTPDELRITAYHESGHALAAWRLDRPVGLVSIRPSQRYAGITVVGRVALPDGLDLAAPTSLQQPAAIRDFFEREIVISLAGAAAERYVARPGGYKEPDPCEAAAETAAASLASQSPRDRELLDRLEGPDYVPHTDEDRAAEYSMAFVGSPSEAPMHVAWLRVVAANLVDNQRFRLDAVAAALFDRHVINGDDAVAILANAERTYTP